MPLASHTLPVRRSFVRRALDALGAQWRPCGDTAVASHLPQERPDAAVRLRDLSPLPRTGFKGADTPAWLDSQGLGLPEAPNRATVQADGTLIARLSASEFLLLGTEAAGTVDALSAAWSLDVADLCVQVPRRDSHAWFFIDGPGAPALFAKLCAVDLRLKAFPPLSIAQTSIAHMSGILIAAPEGGFHLLAESASALYLWEVLIDAMAEFHGCVMGLG